MNVVRCSKCQTPLPSEMLGAQVAIRCPRCRAALEVLVFPAVHREIGRGNVGEAALGEGETTCFFHPEKKAAVVCNGCGRFLCALCDVPVAGDHLCPKCVESGRTKKTLTTFENYRTSYPSLALTLAFLPLLLYPTTLVTAPATLFLVIFGWKKPGSVTGRRRRPTMIVAFLAALAQCLVWGWVLVRIYGSVTHG